MQRCFLRGLVGDAINATLAAAGSNLLKLRVSARADFFWLRYAFSEPDAVRQNSLRPVMVPLIGDKRIRRKQSRPLK